MVDLQLAFLEILHAVGYSLLEKMVDLQPSTLSKKSAGKIQFTRKNGRSATDRYMHQ